MIGADVEPADVVAHDDEDVRRLFLSLGRSRLGRQRGCAEKGCKPRRKTIRPMFHMSSPAAPRRRSRSLRALSKRPRSKNTRAPPLMQPLDETYVNQAARSAWSLLALMR